MDAYSIHVFYTDTLNGWAVTILDENEFQIGEADYTYRKADAINIAKRHGLTTHIFGRRTGLHQRTIDAPA
jgi:hypothetical protein